jgi:tetratricopeptide (TPR) repeat protein
VFAGRHEEAIPVLKKALRLDPFPLNSNYNLLGVAYRFLGRYEEAIAAFERAIELAPDSAWRRLAIAAAYSLAGRDKEARAAVQEALRLDPKMSLEFIAKTAPYKKQEDLEEFLDAVRKAGLK